MATVEQAEKHITAEEFARRPDSGFFEELVRGRVVMSPSPGSRHGAVCYMFGWLLGNYVVPRGAGRILSNDSGILDSSS